ncbi:uncharacterized protein LOC133734582 [Rosa rugosa]|uniref:uncharacterized protein LOC133734582 n=1 Tax=Rosa rugosa TaxID=74645 RepID=UPI002B40DE18|nr:uncharacterized protein LOC133734582 [Rosa rugosa]
MFSLGRVFIKVKIMLDWDPNGKQGPMTPLPDLVTIHQPKDDELISLSGGHQKLKQHLFWSQLMLFFSCFQEDAVKQLQSLQKEIQDSMNELEEMRPLYENQVMREKEMTKGYVLSTHALSSPFQRHSIWCNTITKEKAGLNESQWIVSRGVSE